MGTIVELGIKVIVKKLVCKVISEGRSDVHKKQIEKQIVNEKYNNIIKNNGGA